MCKSFSKKIWSITICMALLVCNLVYADSVVIGSAPGVGANNRVMDTNASTTFLQNQYSGPGIMPNSSVTGYSPIQTSNGVATGQASTKIDSNGVSDTGPNPTYIASPKSAGESQQLYGKKSTGTISNGAFNTKVDNSSTADAGPTVHEIAAPVAGGVSINSDDNSGPGYPTPLDAQSTTTTDQSSYQSYTTDTSYNYVSADGPIIYQLNNYIAAVKPNIVAPGALVVNATTRQIYFSKGGLNPFHPAAITNLVTAAVALKYKGLDDVILVTDNAIKNLESGANTAGLKAGDTIKLRDAIGAMFTKSCCDVSNAVAENVSGSIPNFVLLMNQTVKEWGCVGTNFTNPTGLNNDSQIITTYDAAIIMDKVTSDPTLKFLLMQPAYAFPATAHSGAKALTTSNQLLIQGNKNYYAGVASRMGYTSKAGYTIVSELDYNGQRLIAVALKANGTQYTDTTKLLNFAKVASLETSSQAATTYNSVLSSMTNVMVINSAAAEGTAALNSALAAANANAANVANATNAANAIAALNANVAANAAANTSEDTAGTWQKNANGWYFIKANGQSAANEWIRQNNKVYCIDSNGYMVTGWKTMSNGSTYYFDPSSGEMRYNTWVNVSTGAYYLQEDGSLAKASPGTTTTITTAVGTYSIDENGKALAKISR